MSCHRVWNCDDVKLVGVGRAEWEELYMHQVSRKQTRDFKHNIYGSSAHNNENSSTLHIPSYISCVLLLLRVLRVIYLFCLSIPEGKRRGSTSNIQGFQFSNLLGNLFPTLTRPTFFLFLFFFFLLLKCTMLLGGVLEWLGCQNKVGHRDLFVVVVQKQAPWNICSTPKTWTVFMPS